MATIYTVVFDRLTNANEGENCNTSVYLKINSLCLVIYHSKERKTFMKKVCFCKLQH